MADLPPPRGQRHTSKSFRVALPHRMARIPSRLRGNQLKKMSFMNTPLSPELLIVEMGERLAAGAAGCILAELGATVVVIERSAGRPHEGKVKHRATLTAGK